MIGRRSRWPLRAAACTLSVIVVAGFTSCHQNTELGDLVWHDVNEDGVQDAGEPGVAGVTVEVCVRSQTESTTCRTTVTDESGAWVFRFTVDLLDESDVDIRFDYPSHYRSTWTDAGNDDTRDSDGGWVLRSYSHDEAPERDDTIDLGLIQREAIIGDFVWHDLDADGDQDIGEPGVANILVDLLNENGAVEDTTRSRADGSYTFTARAGNYQLRFGDLPAGVTFTTRRATVFTRDSDVDPQTGLTDLRFFSEIVTNSTIDAGLLSDQPIRTVSEIGDLVWHDDDGDGHQDPDESGAAGVGVELRDNDGVTIDETITDTKGRYRFANLDPGEYTLRFVAPNGLGFSQRDRGRDDRLDSDAGPDGVSHVISLGAGRVDDTVDAGLVPRPPSN